MKSIPSVSETTTGQLKKLYLSLSTTENVSIICERNNKVRIKCAQIFHADFIVNLEKVFLKNKFHCMVCNSNPCYKGNNTQTREMICSVY